MEAPRVSRRRFLDWFLGTSAGALLAALLYPVVRFLDPPRAAEASAHEVDAGPINDPSFIDRGFKVVSFGADPVIVVRVGEGDFRAFAATCTHLSCIVENKTDLQSNDDPQYQLELRINRLVTSPEHDDQSPDTPANETQKQKCHLRHPFGHMVLTTHGLVIKENPGRQRRDHGNPRPTRTHI
jgi:hypothetical protein